MFAYTPPLPTPTLFYSYSTIAFRLQMRWRGIWGREESTTGDQTKRASLLLEYKEDAGDGGEGRLSSTSVCILSLILEESVPPELKQDLQP